MGRSCQGVFVCGAGGLGGLGLGGLGSGAYSIASVLKFLENLHAGASSALSEFSYLNNFLQNIRFPSCMLSLGHGLTSGELTLDVF